MTIAKMKTGMRNFRSTNFNFKSLCILRIGPVLSVLVNLKQKFGLIESSDNRIDIILSTIQIGTSMKSVLCNPCNLAGTLIIQVAGTKWAGYNMKLCRGGEE